MEGKLVASKLDQWYNWYLSRDGIGHSAINSLIFLTNARGKYVKMYERFIMQLQIYAKVIRILSKGYLPTSLLPPSKLQEILCKVKKANQTTNPGYDLVIKRLHLYSDIKLVTFEIDGNRNLIIQFPVFVQPFTQQPLILYQIETVPVLIIANSYTHLQIDRPYIILDSEMYLSLRHQELATYKKISYEFLL